MSTVLTFKNFYNRSTSQALDGAQGVCVSPDNEHVYACGYAKDGVVAFDREANGDLTFIAAYQGTGVGGTVADMDAPRAIHCSADGKNVYVVCSNSDSIVCFDRNPANGQLNASSVVKNNVGGVSGLNGAREMCISPNDGWVFAVSSYDDAITIFERNTTTGALTYKGENASGAANAPYGICIASNGVDIYVASSSNDTLLACKFDEPGLAVIVSQKVKNGAGGQGLDAARAVAISPDDRHVYCVGRNSDALSVYTVGGDGTLTFVAVYTDTGKGGTIDNLNSPQNLIVSNDGAYVFCTAYSSDAVNAFSRNATTGELVQEQTLKDGQGGVNGLNGARALAQTPNNSTLYTTGRNDDAVSVFEVA